MTGRLKEYPPIGIRRPEKGRLVLFVNFGDVVPAIVMGADAENVYRVNLTVFGNSGTFRVDGVPYVDGMLNQSHSWHWPAWAI